MEQVATTLNRNRGLVIGTDEHFRWLYSIAKWVLLLNLLDGVFTLIWVEHFNATR